MWLSFFRIIYEMVRWFLLLGIILIILCIICAACLRLGFKSEIFGNDDSIPGPHVPIEDLKSMGKIINYEDPILNDKGVFYVHGEQYIDIHSNRQIAQVVKFGNASDRARLIQILAKQMHGIGNLSDKFQIVDRWFNKKEDDRTIYTELCKYIGDKPAPIHVYNFRNERQAKEIYRILAKHAFPDKPYNARILDIGCGNGRISELLKNYIEADSKNKVTIDMNCAEVYKDPTRTEGIKFTELNPKDFSWKLPYPDESFDLVVSIMSLHHIEDKLENMLAEIARILKPGGKFFIKEHDTWTAMDAMLVDIEHAMHMFCREHNRDFTGYHCRHMNYYGWIELLKRYFKPIAWDYFYINVKYDINLTRAMWAIFLK